MSEIQTFVPGRGWVRADELRRERNTIAEFSGSWAAMTLEGIKKMFARPEEKAATSLRVPVRLVPKDSVTPEEGAAQHG